MSKLNIVCFGEVLWDIFPEYRKIGGAPLNVANRLNTLSNNVSIISKIGNDKPGFTILYHMGDIGIDTELIQVDDNLKTGEVQVTLDASGSATYDIVYPTAWDAIELTNTSKNKVTNADVFIFGSLIARHKDSKKTLIQLLEVAKYKVFDINLRPPFYSEETLVELMNHSSLIKFNDEELDIVSMYLGEKKNTIEEQITLISKQTNTNTICVTMGAKGAVLYHNSSFFYNSGYKIDVVDTVGAGDSFLATLINCLRKDNNPQYALNRACAIGTLVAGSKGANPIITDESVDKLMAQQTPN